MKILKNIVIGVILLASTAIALADAIITENKFGYTVASPWFFVWPAGIYAAYILDRLWKPMDKHQRKSIVVKMPMQGWMARSRKEKRV